MDNDKKQNVEKGKKKKPRYSQPKFLIAFVVVMGVFAAIRYAFSVDVPIHADDEQLYEDEHFATTNNEEYNPIVSMSDVEEEEYMAEEFIVYDAEPDSMPFDSSHHMTVVTSPEENLLIGHPINDPNSPKKRHRIRGVRSYSACFPDVQDVQIMAAQRHGIRPVRDRTEAEELVKSYELVNICHSPFYVVDDLTHSIPYLVPKAQELLNTICLNFLDSCQVKGLPPHLPIITSVLRTTDDVSRLQRGNQNATTNSCHCYGTTVDIAYNRFLPVTGTYYSNAALLRWNEPMKQVLAEVLYDLRMQNKCYVKYERKQGCFHLTCR